MQRNINSTIRVAFFQRNPGKQLFSIEVLFESVRYHLPPSIQAQVVISSRMNGGIFNKLYNIFEVIFRTQGDVNHVTGDVHYVTFFLKKKKTILTIHDVNLMYSSNPIKKFIHRWFWLKIPISKVAVVTAISETTKKEIVKYAKCAPDKIRIIYNCISPKFQPSPKEFNEKKPVLLHVGVKPNKNLNRLIQAIAGIPCKLQIIGRPPADAIQLLKEHNIDYAWQENLTEEEVVSKYEECDMLVFVSTFEGFGLPIIEANTVERPVVTSNVSSMPEIAGQAACLVNPFDVGSIRQGILQVIKDQRYREALVEKGKNNRERFSPERISRAYCELYEELYFEGVKKVTSVTT